MEAAHCLKSPYPCSFQAFHQGMSIQTPAKDNKRKVAKTDLTPDNMPYKVGRTMDLEEVKTVLENIDMNFLKEAGKCLPKLLSCSDFEITETVPNNIMEELLVKGVLDEVMNLTEEDGSTKTRIGNAAQLYPGNYDDEIKVGEETLTTLSEKMKSRRQTL